MTYRVMVLARARRDVEEVVAWLAERSPKAADLWVTRFEAALARLERNPYTAAVAPESRRLDDEVRHVLFRSKSGRTYRALFVIVDDEVRVLRVRGSGQPPVGPDDLDE